MVAVSNNRIKHAFNNRPLPSLAEWLGDGTRADGFEEWVREAISLEDEMASEQDKLTVRVLRTLSIACVEILRSEYERSGTSVPALVTLARSCGVATMYAALSVVDPEKLLGGAAEIAETMSKEFSYGASRIGEATVQLNRQRRG
jgi:hypothetical protein